MCFFNNRKWCATILTSLSVMLIACCTETFALPATPTGTNHLPGCGDYSILNNSSDRIELEKHCASKEDVDLMAMKKTIDRLSPENEARSAAKRGDFRLAALIGGGPPRPGQD